MPYTFEPQNCGTNISVLQLTSSKKQTSMHKVIN